MSAVAELLPAVPLRVATRALGASHATWYRRRRPRVVSGERPRPASPLVYSIEERQAMLATLNEPRFADCAPRTVWARLLDEGIYLGSVSTLYRVLAAAGQSQERRNQLIHPAHAKPELIATGPNQVWSWDITRLRGSLKWQFFYLYVLLDIFSRYVVGWLVAQAENAALAQVLIEESCHKHGIARDTLKLHSDRGSPMRAKTTAELLVDLGVAASFSRPRVSNDNPFSESQFKTLKYDPTFPECFAGLQHARAFLRPWFTWYNEEHLHCGIGFMTPAAVHFQRAADLREQRAQVLQAAFAANPARFKHRAPTPPELPTVVGINLPKPVIQTQETSHDVGATPKMLTNFANPVSQTH
jgi:putative transposase